MVEKSIISSKVISTFPIKKQTKIFFILFPGQSKTRSPQRKDNQTRQTRRKIRRR